MTCRLSHMICQPMFIETDESGDVVAGPYPVTNEAGQPLTFTVPAAEWKAGWDWQEALASLESQLNEPPAPSPNGIKPKAKKAARK